MPRGENGVSLGLTVDMPGGEGDKSGMKRPLFNLMKRNYAASVLRVLVSEIVDSDRLALPEKTSR